MAKAKYLSGDKKSEISRLFHESNLSVGRIADELGVSPRTVHNYKNYNGQDEDRSYDIQPELYDRQEIEEEDQYQDTDLEDESDEYELENETIEQEEDFESKSWPMEEILECPECGKPKSECLTIDQALEQGYRIPEGFERFYDYACSDPECRTLFPDYRYKIEGTCPDPECGSTSRDWIPIEQYPNIIEEEIEEYDFVCLDCGELIKVSD